LKPEPVNLFMNLKIPDLFQNMSGVKMEIMTGLYIIGLEKELKKK